MVCGRDEQSKPRISNLKKERIMIPTEHLGSGGHLLFLNGQVQPRGPLLPRANVIPKPWVTQDSKGQISVGRTASALAVSDNLFVRSNACFRKPFLKLGKGLIIHCAIQQFLPFQPNSPWDMSTPGTLLRIYP